MVTIIDAIWLMMYVLMGVFGVLIVVFIAVMRRMGKKNTAKFLLYHTKDMCEMVSAEIKDGKASIGKKTYALKDAPVSLFRHKMLKILPARSPLYVVDVVSPKPIIMPILSKKDRKAKYTPENLQKFIKNETLNLLMSPKKESMKMMVVGVILGGIMGLSFGLIIGMIGI